jgi:TolB-like protein
VSPSPVHFYIYYRIAAAHAADARTALEGVMHALEQRFAVSGRLLHAQDDADLWMEVYESVGDPATFEAAMNKLLAETRFASWLAPGSARCTERFVAMAT